MVISRREKELYAHEKAGRKMGRRQTLRSYMGIGYTYSGSRAVFGSCLSLRASDAVFRGSHRLYFVLLFV